VSALVSVVVKWPILISISVVGRCALQLFFIWRSFESKYHYPLASTTTTQSIWKTRTSPSRGETYSLSTERQPPAIRRDHLPQYGKTTSHNTEKPPPFNNGPHTSFMERRAHLAHKTYLSHSSPVCPMIFFAGVIAVYTLTESNTWQTVLPALFLRRALYRSELQGTRLWTRSPFAPNKHLDPRQTRSSTW
jgi:hypothetical protein